mgnify:CR=1 FL=1
MTSLFFDKRRFPFLEEEDITSLEEKGIENPADFIRASVSEVINYFCRNLIEKFLT